MPNCPAAGARRRSHRGEPGDQEGVTRDVRKRQRAFCSAILDNWDYLADEEIVVCLERLFNPCTYLSATGEGIVTEQQVTDIKTAVEFFNKDPTIDCDMKTEYTTFVDGVAESKQHHASWKYDKDERGRDHKRKGEWVPLKIIEHLKNPQTGMARGILQLSQLAGIAALLNPSSCCTERLVKEHKCGIFVNTITGGS